MSEQLPPGVPPDAVATGAEADRKARERALIMERLAASIAEDPAIDNVRDEDAIELWENADQPRVLSLGWSGPMAALDAERRRQLEEGAGG